MATKTDLRIIRTHKLIRQAFIQLLQQQSFEQISVQDIVETAMINRKTFYKYYSGKSDLAGTMIKEFKQMYAEHIEKRLAGQSLKQFLAELSPWVFAQRELLLALWKIRTRRHHLYQDMHQMLKNFFLAQSERLQHQTPFLDFQSNLAATIILESATYCLEHNQPLPFVKDLKVLHQVLAVMESN